MKKLVLPFTVILSSTLSFSVFAKNDAQLLAEAQKNVFSIAQAAKAADETGVTVKGVVVRQINNDQYEIKDATGSITVEIDHHLALPKDLAVGKALTILAEVDTSRTKPTELDAIRVEISNTHTAMPLASQQSVVPSAAQKATVAQALKAADEALVSVEGEIVRHIRGDDYELKDATGIIRVDIDDSLISAQKLKVGTKVSVVAEVDVSRFKATKLDVQQITIR